MPGLHITLGIIQRLFKLMEDECHDLDLQIAAHKASTLPEETAAVFQRVWKAHQQLRELREELAVQQQHVSFLDQTMTLLALNTQVQNSSQLNAVRLEARQSREKMKQLVHKNECKCHTRIIIIMHGTGEGN